MNAPIPLEDQLVDIVGKAMRGLKLGEPEVAVRSGVLEGEVRRLREGEVDPRVVRAIAPVLGLGAEALVASGAASWRPAPVAVDGLAGFNTPFEDMTVNSYLVWDRAAKVAIAFDTGADCSDMLEVLRVEGLTLKAILLTHTHGDHIFDLDRLREKTGAPAFTSVREPLEGAAPIDAGRTFEAGSLQVEVRSTWGHSKGGLTYVVRGLARPVAVVGDAVFAGSMGGGGVSYSDALRTNREEILSLPPETVLCPGHGPLTTVGEEKVHNPFFAV
jgi:hydroxyacylglutathione hydrolase